MAVPVKRKAKTKHSSLTVVLLDTRLKKFSVEILLQVEQAGKGSMHLSYNIFTSPIEDINSHATSLRIEGKGFNIEDPTKIAFTIDAEMVGLFSLSRKLNDEELETRVSIEMANYVAPVLADTIETAMVKAGYPRLKIPRSVPESIS